MRYETKLDGTRAWVREFNAIPQSFIVKAYGVDLFDEVEILGSPELECAYCGAENEKGATQCESCGSEEDLLPKLALPMWGTMWTFGEKLDEDWARDNAEVLAECGFYVYESDELGVFIGIDGAGYDFYDAHWVPLYEKRGLKWHNEN